MNVRQRRGQEGEDSVVRHLEKNGYRIVARNWRPGSKSGGAGMRGEIDVIAWHGKTLCFIEVKTRSGDAFGAPQESVNRSKQRQLSRLANAYVSFHRLDVSCRFDVAEVWLLPGNPPRMEVHQNAFDYCG
jgi:putative endonuclease